MLNQTIASLKSQGFSDYSLNQIATYGITVKYVTLASWKQYQESLESNEKYKLTEKDILDSHILYGLDALVVFHRAAKGLWYNRVFDKHGDSTDLYQDPKVLEVPLIEMDDENNTVITSSISKLLQDGKLDGAFSNYGGSVGHNKGFQFVIYMRPSIRNVRTIIYNYKKDKVTGELVPILDDKGQHTNRVQWVYKEVKLPTKVPGITIKGGKIEGGNTLDGDVAKPQVTGINQYDLSLTPIGLETTLVNSDTYDPAPENILDDFSYISVCRLDPYQDYTPAFRINDKGKIYIHSYKKVVRVPKDLILIKVKGKVEKPTKSLLASLKAYSSNAIKVKQKNHSPDKTQGKGYLTRKYSDVKLFPGLDQSVEIEYVLSCSDSFVFLDIITLKGEELLLSLPIYRYHVSVEYTPKGLQPKIVPITIQINIPSILGGKIDLPTLEALYFKNTVPKTKTLKEANTHTGGIAYTIPRLLSALYTHHGYRINDDGLWVDWLKDRDQVLWSSIEDGSFLTDDGKTYDGSHVYITPSVRGSHEIECFYKGVLKGEATIAKIQQNQNQVLSTLQANQRHLMTGGNDTSHRALLIGLGYNLDGMNSKQVKSLVNKLKRKGKINP